MKFTRNFKKTVWGYAVVNAPNKKKAQGLFDVGETDYEYDNESDYEWDDNIQAEI